LRTAATAASEGNPLAQRLADIADVGHALERHGSLVTDQQLVTRAITGVAPDGSFVLRNGQVQIPPMSSAFNSDAALAQSDLYLRQNYLDQAIALNPGEDSLSIVGVDVGDAVGRGYCRMTTTPTPDALGPIQLIDNLTRVTGVYRFDALTGMWKTWTLYPSL
jgi:hypothetical protein